MRLNILPWEITPGADIFFAIAESAQGKDGNLKHYQIENGYIIFLFIWLVLCCFDALFQSCTNCHKIFKIRAYVRSLNPTYARYIQLGHLIPHNIW